MRPHPLTNFEIQKCYRNEPRFNGVYSRDNVLKTKDRAEKTSTKFTNLFSPNKF